MSYQWEEIYSGQFEVPKNRKKLPSPLGYKESTHKSSAPVPKTKNISLEKLRMKKNWEFSYSPLKNLPMNLVMSYFAPNSLQLMSILMVFNFFLTPLKEITSNLSRFDTFENVEPIDAMLMKACYIACWLCNLGVGVWKLNSMGLIPNARSDWLSWETALTVLERT